MKNLFIFLSLVVSCNLWAQKLDLSESAIKKAIQQSETSKPSSSGNVTDKKFIIKVTHNSVLKTDWAKRICNVAVNDLVDVYGANNQFSCFFDSVTEVTNQKTYEAQKKYFDFELDLDNTLDAKFRVALINLKQNDVNFTNKVGWMIEYDTMENFQVDRLQNSFFAINNLTVIRDVAVELIYKSANKNYVKNKETTREQMYSKLKASGLWNKETRKFLTASTELIASLSFGWYGYNFLSTNTQDFDYPNESLINILSNKFSGGDMVRYDDNSWNTNKNHVYAGVVYYLECRGIGFTALQSYLCAIAGSTAWENLIEWREVFSINDQIYTSTGGAILAESIHQLGNYIDKRAPKWFQKSIGWLWKGPKKMNQYYDRKVLGGEDEDLESFNNVADGKFEFEVGTMKYNNGVSQKRIGIFNEVNTIPMALSEGKEVKFIREIVESNLSLNGPSTNFTNEYDLFAKIVMAAYFNKNITKNERDELNGYSFYIGPSAAIDIKNDYKGKDDFLGVVHIVGTSAKLVNFYKGLKITSTLDFWGDVVMMKSMTVEDYKGANPNSLLVGNLANSDYYHGFGVTTNGSVIIEYGKWAFGAGIGNNYSENTNGRQRTLGQALTNINIARNNLSGQVFVERKITDNFKVKFIVEKELSSETLSGFGSASRDTVTKKISLIYYF